MTFQSLVIPEKFQHILRVMNTNIDGRRKVPFAMTSIKVCLQNSQCFLLDLGLIGTGTYCLDLVSVLHVIQCKVSSKINLLKTKDLSGKTVQRLP